ncbi:hypothetical protein GCT19_40735 [Paraburkholderia sp. CNPSo 3155]|uniref:hypothetical protein n=1 Tax=Paraburkholderia atlantica TaxID=2654982 RepID=UPI00128D8EBC|nr:hypothetical protein [Paraburkholderia atlantica]MPW11658.1 hypothetical protein [Paraburkholderia atlantica]
MTFKSSFPALAGFNVTLLILRFKARRISNRQQRGGLVLAQTPLRKAPRLNMRHPIRQEAGYNLSLSCSEIKNLSLC